MSQQNRDLKNTFKIQSGIVEQLHSVEDVQIYNYYEIANIYLNKRSGLFTLDEFVDVLTNVEGFEHRALICRSNRNKFKKILFKKFKQASMFFQHINKETFKFISYKKILNKLGTSKFKNDYIHFKIRAMMDYKKFSLYKRTFMDLCIGTYLLSHNNFSNEQVAKHFGITVYRVQLATRRNQQKGLIKKNFRLAETLCESKQDAKEKQCKLWDVGISSVIKEKRKAYYLCTYRTNDYNTNLPSHNGRVRSSAEASSIKKRYSLITDRSSLIFKLENGKNLKLNIPKKNKDFLYFNFLESDWSLDEYVQKYGNIYA